jgi:light-regulated signal transduction histidine kinase (bacteriophytochrome)
MRFEMLTSRNMDVDRMQRELVDAQNEIRKFAYSAKDRGLDVSEELKQVLEAVDRMAQKLADKTYGKVEAKP